ncbi:cation diffusion facilitator family transporter [Demequina aestuarii]|uniref:cation diffusion facilitator family transporter n=1 Tax=Demequina aestuarii TaxID=327095 RepID=UPI0007802D48|nr:cation diffusion facilitator family transporter [Demequina aestuarii]
MGHSHSPAAHVGARYRNRLLVVFVLVVVFMAAEVAAAILSGSLALLADAGHMTADAVTLGAAYVATRVATRVDTTGTRTYGSYRAEVFASGLAVLIMLGVAVLVAVEALGRIGAPAEVSTTPMLVVGVLGLLVNALSMLILRAGAKESLNVKGAYLEVIADAAGSVGVIVAGALILVTGDGVWDVVVGLAIAAFVAVRAAILGREVLAVLGQHAPRGFDAAAAVADLRAVEDVVEVHDLHAWTLTSGMNVATAHLMVTATADLQTVLATAQSVLSERYEIAHATLQVESAASRQCEEVTW